MSRCEFCGCRHAIALDCPPVWEILDRRCNGEDLQEVRARDEEEAAVTYIEEWDQDDPCLYDGGDTVHDFFVRKKGEAIWTEYSGWGEATINYYATKKK